MSVLALVAEQPAQIDVSYWGEVLLFASRVADAVSDTEFVPGALRGRREAVAATIIYGAEVGLTPMQALAGIHIVDGRPAPSAELCRAMILRAGHTLTVHEMTGTRARVSGLRRGRPDAERVVVEWTSDMARAAGLLNKQNWQRYPRAMLTARATGDLARLLFPDVIKGLGYVAEDSVDELESWAPVDGAAPAVKAPRKAIQRRKGPASPPPATDVALPAAKPVQGDEAPVAPTLDEREIVDAPTDRWLTDEEALADSQRLADEARQAVEESLTEPPAVSERDEPLPDELQPVGTGRPVTPATRPVPTLPDLEPEAPDDEGADDAPPIMGVRPFKALQAGLSEQLGSAATPEERHALVAAIVGHPVESTKRLTRADGYLALSYVGKDGRFADGSAAWEFVDGGKGIRVYPTLEPPPDAE